MPRLAPSASCFLPGAMAGLLALGVAAGLATWPAPGPIAPAPAAAPRPAEVAAQAAVRRWLARTEEGRAAIVFLAWDGPRAVPGVGYGYLIAFSQGVAYDATVDATVRRPVGGVLGIAPGTATIRARYYFLRSRVVAEGDPDDPPPAPPSARDVRIGPQD